MPDPVVIDASALVDFLVGAPLGDAVQRRLADQELHAPAHLDAEALSAFGRLNRAGELSDDAVEPRLSALAAASIERHPLANLVAGAWARRHHVRLSDALYVELSDQLAAPLVTTDTRLIAASSAVELISAES